MSFGGATVQPNQPFRRSPLITPEGVATVGSEALDKVGIGQRSHAPCFTVSPGSLSNSYQATPSHAKPRQVKPGQSKTLTYITCLAWAIDAICYK
ncbi:hypothetical protein E2C01_081654 [Portunus trituberculatus]|uniref:Uncharacterized protein n=1 Tax=Portunus trituberculatus TaxID=210409 RepID=A0A5B7J1Q2_PORTR|nr:hypothetical protein [Portunus trituberculatus]